MTCVRDEGMGLVEKKLLMMVRMPGPTRDFLSEQVGTIRGVGGSH